MNKQRKVKNVLRGVRKVVSIIMLPFMWAFYLVLYVLLSVILLLDKGNDEAYPHSKER